MPSRELHEEQPNGDATERALHRDPEAIATLEAQNAALDPIDAEARRTSDKVPKAALSLTDKAVAENDL